MLHHQRWIFNVYIKYIGELASINEQAKFFYKRGDQMILKK